VVNGTDNIHSQNIHSWSYVVPVCDPTSGTGSNTVCPDIFSGGWKSNAMQPWEEVTNEILNAYIVAGFGSGLTVTMTDGSSGGGSGKCAPAMASPSTSFSMQETVAMCIPAASACSAQTTNVTATLTETEAGGGSLIGTVTIPVCTSGSGSGRGSGSGTCSSGQTSGTSAVLSLGSVPILLGFAVDEYTTVTFPSGYENACFPDPASMTPVGANSGTKPFPFALALFLVLFVFLIMKLVTHKPH